MLPVFLTVLASAAVTPAVGAALPQDPSIRVWINKDGYVERTDKVRAYVRTGVDGFVTILHAEPSGRVRVLFPLDPDGDSWVRAGRDYEIRSRGDKEAFRVYDGTGIGVILAVISRDPFNYEGLVMNRHWDYRAAAFGVGNDGEADLLEVAHAITGGAWFDYDVVRYEVGSYAVADGGGYSLSLYGPAYAGHYWTGGVGFSISFGVGWYDPWYYPYYSGYWPYYGYGYGWGYNPWYGYPCCGWYYPTPYRYAYYPYYPAYPSPRHYYAAGGYYGGYGGAWGTYAFKSYEDRYGLNPRSIEARRRTIPARGTYASASDPARAVTSRGARRTAAASSPATVPTRGTSAGSLEARRRTTGAGTTGAAPATRLPTIHGRRRAAASQPSTPVGTEATPATADRRRTVPGTAGTGTAAGATRRGLETVGNTRARTTTATGTRGAVQGRSGSQNGLRQIVPQRVQPRSPATSAAGRTPSRLMPGTVGSGRTLRPSTGSLQRRVPAGTVTPSRGATRAAPSRAMPRATPARPPTTRSAPSRAPARPPARAPARSAPRRR